MAPKPPTSLIAEGQETPPPDSLSEVGSSQGSYIPDLVPQLITLATAVRKYEEMTNTDATVDVSLRGAKMPIFAANFFIDVGNTADPQALDVAEFVYYNMFTAMEKGWLEFLENCCRMYELGFSPFELVWENRQWAPDRAMANRKTYTMLKKVASRPATTISDIQYDDNGELLSLSQQAIGQGGASREVDLPLEKTVVFTLNMKNGRIQGKSLLRTAYQHWFYKTHLYKVDAIQKERHGIGVPDIELPPGFTEKDKTAAHELGRNLRTNENAYIVRPPGINVGFAHLQGQPVNVMTSIDHHNSMIMLNTMMEFMLLGVEGSGGGRATSASQYDMFQKSLRYIANYICEIWNIYIIPKLVSYNFDTDKFPKLQVRNVGETKDLQMLAAALANLADKQLITLDLETEQWVRQQFDMPAKSGDRPTEAELANVREQILLQGQAPPELGGDSSASPQKPGLLTKVRSALPGKSGPTGASGPGNNGNTSTVGNKIQTGNVGKGVTEP